MNDNCLLVNSVLSKKKILNYIKNNRNKEICLKYFSDFSNTKLIRLIVLLICKYYNIPAMIQSRIILIVDELNNNAIEYWSQKDDINKLVLNIIKYENTIKLNIEVTDSWKWAFAKKAFMMENLRDIKLKAWFDEYVSIRGRGLFMIITKIVDKLYFKDDIEAWLIVWVDLTIDI